MVSWYWVGHSSTPGREEGMAQAAHPAVGKMSERGTGKRKGILSMQTQQIEKRMRVMAVKNVIGQPYG